MEICKLLTSFARRSKAKALMLWWDDLIPKHNTMENNSSQESHVEGQVNDQQVKKQKGGLGSKSRHKDALKVSDGTVTFKGFSYEVGTGNSTYISGKYRQGVIDDDLDKINSYDDLKAFLDKQIEEKKERDKKKPSKYSKVTEEELLLNLAEVLKALEEKTGKSPAELCKGAQEAWKQRELEKAIKEEEELAEALQKARERKEALQAKQAL